jgi:hypothetical protein
MSEGNGDQVSEISSWLYECLRERMESLDGVGVLSDLNRLVHGRGFRRHHDCCRGYVQHQ